MTPARTSSCTTSFSKGEDLGWEWKATFLIGTAKLMAGLTPRHCHACTGVLPEHVCQLCGTAEAQKAWDSVRAGCLQGVFLIPAEYNEKEGPWDVDEWTRIAWVLCPTPLWDSVLWHLPVGSWHSWHMKLRVIASWTSWGR